MHNKKHIIGFDYLRVLAAFSVVWIHGCYTNELLARLSIINTYAVPSFILISVYLFGVKYNNEVIDKKTAIKHLLKKLLPQYFFWTIIYLGLRLIKNYFLHKSLEINFSTLFLGGSAIQLWFLPAIIIWHIFLIYYWNFVHFLLLDVILMLVVFFGGRYLMVHGYLQTGFFNCFALYSGYVFAAKIIYKNKLKLMDISTLYYFIMSGICLFVLFVTSNYFWSVLFSLTLFLSFLSLNVKSLNIIKSLSLNSFGIYLIHFVFIQLIVSFFGYFNFKINTIYFTLGTIFISFILSYLTSITFKRIPLLKNLV